MICSSSEHLRREVPQPAVQPHILADRSDAPRARQLAARRPPADTGHSEVLMDAVKDAPEVVTGVLDPRRQVNS